MLKFLLLVVLFMIFKKDLFEGMESSEESVTDASGNTTGSSSTESSSTGTSSTGSSSTGSTSRNARVESMSDTIEEDENSYFTINSLLSLGNINPFKLETIQ